MYSLIYVKLCRCNSQKTNPLKDNWRKSHLPISKMSSFFVMYVSALCSIKQIQSILTMHARIAYHPNKHFHIKIDQAEILIFSNGISEDQMVWKSRFIWKLGELKFPISTYYISLLACQHFGRSISFLEPETVKQLPDLQPRYFTRWKRYNLSWDPFHTKWLPEVCYTLGPDLNQKGLRW